MLSQNKTAFQDVNVSHIYSSSGPKIKKMLTPLETKQNRKIHRFLFLKNKKLHPTLHLTLFFCNSVTKKSFVFSLF